MNGRSVPVWVGRVLARLEDAGFEAYLVGGCVRDLARGVRPKDWDAATSATPEKVRALFPRTVPTGIRHGTVSVLSGKRRMEVTTFRTEGAYTDNRRPERVVFVQGIHADLSRRDFTVNAMAMDLSGGVIDPFGGLDDIRRGVIRCVGDPYRRFGEDALRMLRALRFAAATGYEIEEATLRAAEALSRLARALSAERVCAELTGILLSPRPEFASQALSLGLLDAFTARPSPRVPHMKRLSGLPRRAGERFSGFCALLLQNGAIPDAEEFLKKLRLDKKTVLDCSAGVRAAASRAVPADAPSWKRLLSELGPRKAACAAAAWDCLSPSGAARALRAVLKSGECWSLSSLRINGEALRALGFPEGPETGRMLSRLLLHVVEHPDDNEPQILSRLAGRAAEGNRPF